MRKILIFDNYDSFTYNLVHLVEKMLHAKVDVVLNDQVPMEKIKAYDKIILSPGPGIPVEAGNLLPLIREFASSKSILGVCLGHQAIGQAFGATLINLQQVYHGVSSPMHILDQEDALYKGLGDTQMVGRYHSWIISRENLPGTLEIKAVDDNNNIMGIRHRDYDIQGVQFHPESILTPCGERIIQNWLYS